MTGLVWFRRDLRVHDHPALHAGAERHERLIPVFCLDDRLLQGPNRSGARARFMLSCLEELRLRLRDLDCDLIVVRGRPELVLPELAAAHGVDEVLACADVSPFARRRDATTAGALRQVGARLELLPGLFAVDDLGGLRTGNGAPYSVFTPFYKRWLQAPRRAPLPAPRALPPLPDGIKISPVPTPAALGIPDRSPPGWIPGERAARGRAANFLEEGMADYADRHDTLGDPGTSGLSPYLHFGCLSPRELESRLPLGPGADALQRQLCWRDFYAHVLLFNPGNARVEHQERYRRRIEWTRSEPLFEAWRHGRTGYPLVDAGMRELAATGWMHNRARMVVGSFLVKDLGIDWRWGERWFMRTLLDGDEANNNGNWQWIASVGVDTQPAGRRIYNPTLQQRRFDPDGHYVRRHLPELAGVPDAYLAEPWTMPPELQREVGCVIGVDYPAPVVDHAMARREAIARYARAAGRPGRDPA